MHGRSLLDSWCARHLRHVINEKRETGNHLWIPERDRWCDIMQMNCKCERDGDNAEVQDRQVSPDKIYTRMKRFITKALSTYSEINYAKFCFHFVPLWGFPCLVGYRRFLLFLLRGDSEVDIYDEFAVLFISSFIFCEILVGCWALVDDIAVSYLSDVPPATLM